MHNGEFATLEAVVAHYVTGGLERPSRSDLMKKVDLTQDEIRDIVEFMKSLTGARQVVALPVLPN
jgi:cytochrome c peroxidase